MREYLEHLRTHVGGDVQGVAAGVVARAAKQQAPVGAEAVVVEADFLVAQRQVLWDQFTGLGR
ncbi:hypothetical protein D3C78_1107490 [compost metagenome]